MTSNSKGRKKKRAGASKASRSKPSRKKGGSAKRAAKKASARASARRTEAVLTARKIFDQGAEASQARAMLGDKLVSLKLVANAFKALGLTTSLATPNKAAHAVAIPTANEMAAPAAVALPPLPAVFPCTEGDTLHCVYTVMNSIVAEAVLYLSPDENGDGLGDRMELIGRSPSAQVSGKTPPLSAGYSYLVWSFHPADQNPWSASLSVSINGGPAMLFGETSGDEASHHDAGMLIWAEPRA